ncbi:MAG TPA: hypothetical protein VN936_00005 [Candidatus Acidoferrum sp.]|nr:hypothetical protein [Candidatus Acidoferrum sp.]
MIAAIVAIVVVAAIAFVVIASIRKRSSPELAVASPSQSTQPALEHAASWTSAEGDDFAALPEAARCDLIFAIQALPGEERTATLRAALDDPSEIVALAAATALTARGERARVEGYFVEHPGSRSQRISRDLSLLSG